jgi:hypothetical protein
VVSGDHPNGELLSAALFTYCRVCHQLLVRDGDDHWVHRPDEAADGSERREGQGALREA